MNNTIVLGTDSASTPNRITSLDIVRGVAILGTLWTNIWLFTNVDGFFGALNATSTPPLTERILTALSQGKFLALLSLLFGIGLSLQYQSAHRRGQRWPGTYRHRMMLLLLDGAINYILIAEFDVLMGYAFTGFIVSYLVLTRPRTQLALIIGLGAVHVLLISWIAWAVYVFPEQPATAPTPYAHGSFIQLVQFRLDNVVLFRAEPVLIAALTVVMFLLGHRLYRAGVLAQDAASIRIVLICLGAVALPLDLALGIHGSSSAVLLERYVLAPFVAVGIFASTVELCHRFGTTSAAARLLSSVGRTTLSCYLLQNLLTGALFYGWGLGLVNHIQSWRVLATMLGYALVSTVVVCCAQWWLRHFSVGPAEWLWKRIGGPIQ